MVSTTGTDVSSSDSGSIVLAAILPIAVITSVFIPISVLLVYVVLRKKKAKVAQEEGKRNLIQVQPS